MASRINHLANTLANNNASNVIIDDKEYNTATEPKLLFQQERSNASFNIRDLTYYLDGGKEATEKMEKIMESIERDPLFNNDNFYDLNKEQLREQTMARVAALNNHIDGENETILTSRFALTGLADPNTITRCGVHFGLFVSSIRGSGTPEQLQYWFSKGAGRLKKFFGCFAMTELGHGSNVAGLETTATWDETTDEFVINTPHLGATKWWIGGAAHTATHSVCFARLIVKGKDYGVKSFVVPLRNLSDFTLKPGIAIGDIGKKMGRDGIDNGWIQYTNVRIPRQFMLMKYAKVDSNGVVTEPPLAQLAYGALIGGRVSMAVDSYHFSKRFITIATRYAAARRQFGSKKGEPETRLLDYPYHQRRLMPRLAFVFAMNAAGAELTEMHTAATSKLASADATNKAELQSAIADIKELFSVSAGVKAFTTWATSEIIDQARQACGGHGYSGYSGFGQGYNDWAVQCTWEGDNNVLTLSAGRSLIQSALAAKKGKKVGAAVEYITRAEQLKSVKLNGRDLTDPKVIVEAWEAAAASALSSATELFEEQLKTNGNNIELAFETLSQQRFETARIHTRLYLIRSFFNRINNSKITSAGIKPILTEVAILFSLWSMELDSGLFLQSGYLLPEDTKRVTKLVDEYNSKVRSQAIPLTDAFNLTDYFINSALGNYDGDVYKHYFEKVTLRNVNKLSKPPYFDSLTKPYLYREDEEEVDLTKLE
ncbi:hypothetical protein D0Z00_000648 [Geotrichum galactomycetum]|uniref:Uncharacterized protein n=1 Tax=Geotrichum galactomycetum TaxID=27317 RepID=A0ACB6V901_9ASCO|nr:hypothetical protein D0Z00_000648 [Geotrichum candidum]